MGMLKSLPYVTPPTHTHTAHHVTHAPTPITREVPAYQELLRRAAAAGCAPQLLLVDGFGALHPRRCGSACHLGVLSGLPTSESTQCRVQQLQ